MTLSRVWHKKLASSYEFQNNSVLFSLMQAAIIVISPQMYKVKKKTDKSVSSLPNSTCHPTA